MNAILKSTARIGAAALLSVCLVAGPVAAETLHISVAMQSYWGNPAYAAMYVVGPGGDYVGTIYVAGGRSRYQRDLSRWYRLMSRSGRGIDGSTGASVGSSDTFGGTVNLPDAMMNAGYALRVETAVEGRYYYADDVSVPLDDAHIGSPVSGTGYVGTLTLQR